MSDERFLFCFGLGFTATALARRLRTAGWRVAGTSRRAVRQPFDRDIMGLEFRRDHPLPAEGRTLLASATHLLVSVPPDMQGDPVLDTCLPPLTEASRLEWIGYLSSTSVYGDTGGAPVDEDAPLRPSGDRGRRRVAAERGWLEFGKARGVAVQVFRLAGIYGPGRSALDKLREQRAQRIDRPGHRFNRVHIEDIASVLEASMARPRPGGIYNVADDEGAEPEKVMAFAASLLGIDPPALVPFEDAARSMSPMALSFWRDNRLVVNRRIREELGVRLAYPSFREGLRAVLASETSNS